MGHESDMLLKLLKAPAYRALWAHFGLLIQPLKPNKSLRQWGDGGYWTAALETAPPG